MMESSPEVETVINGVTESDVTQNRNSNQWGRQNQTSLTIETVINGGDRIKRHHSRNSNQ